MYFIHNSNADFCYTPENFPGLCRSLYECPRILTYFQGALTPEVTNYLRALQCKNGSGRFPYVCCAFTGGFFGQQPTFFPNWPQPSAFPPQQQSVSQPPPPTPLQPLRPPTRLDNVNNQSNGNLNAGFGQCGLPSLAQRIFGGDDAQLDDYPWIVLLEYRNRTYLTHSSGV